MYDLYEMFPRFDSAKSFYGKAHILVDGNKRVLRSYQTSVACFDCATDTLEIYGIWSQTTSRHQREFMRQMGFSVPKPLRAGVYDRDGNKVFV